MKWSLSLVGWFILLPMLSAEDVAFSRQEDVIYGRKYGMVLTMDIFTPKEKANGIGVVFAVSGGFFSSHEAINPKFCQPFLNRGYTVFTVVHGSQPRFTIPEILEDMHRAIRFIRHHAKKYHIDPDRIGIMGGSAGGHLSLMQGTAGKEGDPKAKDPIDRVSSKVQSVACFFPPTDFLNYGKEGEVCLGTGTLSGFKAPFEFVELDPKTKAFVLITDETKRNEIGKTISPVYHVSKDSAPSLIIHGDNDLLVPIQQSELIVQKFKSCNVLCELVVRKDKEHGWIGIEKDLVLFIDWFDKTLRK